MTSQTALGAKSRAAQYTCSPGLVPEVFCSLHGPSPASAFPPCMPGSLGSTSEGQQTTLTVAIVIHAIQQPSCMSLADVISHLPGACSLSIWSFPTSLTRCVTQVNLTEKTETFFPHSPLWTWALFLRLLSYAYLTLPHIATDSCLSPTSAHSAPQTKPWPPGCHTVPSFSAQMSTLFAAVIFALTCSFFLLSGVCPQPDT